MGKDQFVGDYMVLVHDSTLSKMPQNHSFNVFIDAIMWLEILTIAIKLKVVLLFSSSFNKLKLHHTLSEQ